MRKIEALRVYVPSPARRAAASRTHAQTWRIALDARLAAQPRSAAHQRGQRVAVSSLSEGWLTNTVTLVARALLDVLHLFAQLLDRHFHLDRDRRHLDRR